VAQDESDEGLAGRLARGLFRLGFFLPLLVCTYLALIPDPPDNPVLRLSDVILHGAAFAYLTFALCLMLIRRGDGGWAAVRSVGPAVLVAMFGYGLFLEVVQGFIPERTAEMKDLMVDAAGISAGLMLAALFARPVAGLVRFLVDRSLALLGR
jgi:VanZ family protein